MNNNDITESKDFIFKVANIISGNEGCYDSINQYDGSSSSIGVLQWNGFRSKNLLKLIISKNKEQAKRILYSTYILDDVNKDDIFWNNKILDCYECVVIRKLLTTKEGIESQNELLILDIREYIDHGKVLGITDKKALAYFADLENQYGCYTVENIIQNIDKDKELSLYNILTASIQYSSLASYRERHKNTYNRIMKNIF